MSFFLANSTSYFLLFYRSSRTCSVLLDVVCSKLNYTPILFTSKDQKDIPFYHTNVMMWIGTKVVAICAESITDEKASPAFLFRSVQSVSAIFYIVVTFSFFITFRCSKTTLLWRHFACSCILVGRKVNTIATRVRYLCPKKRGVEKGKRTSALEWRMDTHIDALLSPNKVCNPVFLFALKTRINMSVYSSSEDWCPFANTAKSDKKEAECNYLHLVCLVSYYCNLKFIL